MGRFFTLRLCPDRDVPYPALEKAKWFYIMLYALASKSEFWLSLEVNL